MVARTDAVLGRREQRSRRQRRRTPAACDGEDGALDGVGLGNARAATGEIEDLGCLLALAYGMGAVHADAGAGGEFHHLAASGRRLDVIGAAV